MAVVLLVVLADQASKLWVYHHMTMGPKGQIAICGKVLNLTYILTPFFSCLSSHFLSILIVFYNLLYFK